ncbi:cation:proton antiporter [Allokutzneria sp. A3M-2-11 16]|uniref:cation:proton antiporter domain-containing protein n=1 Tax=Allokutzneria sp. A3M-2-11 16 TaxID=2962043 RepID=UPI0020B89ECA|nr:cation:proton antiporter [Allokutzneria sp. A3M-2-11 16]MCP3804860.1 cation:proton antiporter [Allokutzneria sp. A3M-2-11 16]
MTVSARWRQLTAYGLFALVPALGVALVLRGRSAGPVHDPVGSDPAPRADVVNLLLALLTVVVAACVAGAIARKLGQPPVIGEIAAGLALGPSLAPGMSAALFGPGVLVVLDALAQLGVVFFMFLVGADVRLSLLRGNGSRAFVLGHTGIAVPFLFGVLMGAGPLDEYRPAGVASLPFTVFCGVAFSVTAFPVLAKILLARGLSRTRLGTLGLATAGVSDLTAWCVLAFVVAVARESAAGGVLGTVLLSVLFCLVMWFVVRPLLAWLMARLGDHATVVAVVLLGFLLCAAAVTEVIGIGVIFGAFMAGLVVPRETHVVDEFAEQLSAPVNWLLLPVFFAAVGLRTDISTLRGGMWVLLLVIAVGIGGKLLGTWLPGLVVGLPARRAAALGVLMNCRGLTEIVILQIGLSLGVLSVELFTIFVIMALVTTAMTSPLLTLLHRGDPDDAAGSVPIRSNIGTAV